MTDDQKLIAEARRRGVLSRLMNQGAGEPLWDALADALSTAAVRYRAEGWNAAIYEAQDAVTQHWAHETKEPESALGPYLTAIRALLDENNETQEGKQ